MSASREKKQRQGVSGPTQHEIEAQNKAAAYKKKVRTYTIIGVVIAVLVAVLLIWNSGVIQRSQAAAVVGESKYSVNDVNYFYQQIRYNSFLYYYYFGTEVPDDNDIMDANSGKTYRDYFLEQSLESLKEVTALYDEAKANGFTEKDVADIVSEQIAEVKEAAASSGYSYGAYLKLQYGEHMTTSAFKSILTTVAVANEYAALCTDAMEYTNEEIQAYYDENKNTLDTYHYSSLYFTPAEVETTDAEGNEHTEAEIAILKEGALADAKAAAEAALAELQSGSDIAALAEKYELDDSKVVDHVAALGNSLSSAFSEDMYAMSAGDSALVENAEYGYYVIMLHERVLVEDPTADVRHILISAETTTDAEGNLVAPTEEAWAAAKAEADKILAEYQAGAKTGESFAALAEKYSADTGSNSNGGLYEGVDQGDFVTEFDSWLFDSARSAGDVDLLKHEAGESDGNPYYGYHIVYYVGQANPAWMLTSENALRSAESSEWVEGLTSQYTAELAAGSKYVAQ